MTNQTTERLVMTLTEVEADRQRNERDESLAMAEGRHYGYEGVYTRSLLGDF